MRLFAWCLTCSLMLIAVSFSVVPVDAEDTMSSEREAQAMEFARKHHPELATLIAKLKAKDHKGYDAAIRDLFKTSERLERMETKQPERYETELEIWKLDSRIKLLVAKSARKMNDSTRDELKSLLIQRNEIRMRHLEDDRKRLTARLEKLTDTLRQLETNQEAAVEQEIDRLLRTAESQSNPKKPATSPTARRPEGAKQSEVATDSKSNN